MKGKIISIDKIENKIKINEKGKEVEHTVGKKLINSNKIKEGDNIEYNIKGSNFEFIKVLSSEEIEEKGRNNYDNKGNRIQDKTNPVWKIKNYPYNFVSLGDKVIDKGERVLGKYSGILKCTLENKSPLFIMGYKKEENGHSKEYFYKENEDYIIRPLMIYR